MDTRLHDVRYATRTPRAIFQLDAQLASIPSLRSGKTEHQAPSNLGHPASASYQHALPATSRRSSQIPFPYTDLSYVDLSLQAR